MTRRPPMFGAKSGRRPIVPRNTSAGSEVDLRAEMDNILFGEDGGPRHGRLLIIRNFNRDADGYPTLCSCMDDQTTREPDPDCSYCDGEGYIWSEQWVWGFSMFAGSDGGFVRRFVQMPAGYLRVDHKIFFFRYDTVILPGDKIIEPRLDDEGDVELPYVREAIYRPQTLQKRRADNGRVEFIAAFCREKDALRSDNPQ